MRNTLFALLLMLGAAAAWPQSLPSTLKATGQLEVTADQLVRTPWLIVGPVSRAWKVTLEIQGTGLRRLIELPVMSGQPVTWSIPLEPGVRFVRMEGAWDLAAPPLHLSRKPAEKVRGLSVTAVKGNQGQRGFRVEIPSWRTAKGYTPLLTLSVRSSRGWFVQIADASSVKRFEVPAGVPRWSYASEAYSTEPREVTVWSIGDDPVFALLDLQPTGLPPGLPIPADTETLLSWPEERWRTPGHEWFSWSPAPSVLVLVSQSYREQDAWFKRLAFFVEKAGFRGRILSDEQMASMHGWNAHDYQAADLAEFFTQSLVQGIALTSQERELRDRLVAAGILVVDGKTRWKAGEGAVLGIAAESPPSLRSLLFTHEAFHGLYFTSAEFRQVTRDLWNQLSVSAQSAVRKFLKPGLYDTTYEALVVNEFQAYLLQQGPQETPNFIASRIVEKSGLNADEMAQVSVELSSAAQILESLVKKRFGVTGGDVRSVRPWEERTKE